MLTCISTYKHEKIFKFGFLRFCLTIVLCSYNEFKKHNSWKVYSIHTSFMWRQEIRFYLVKFVKDCIEDYEKR